MELDGVTHALAMSMVFPQVASYRVSWRWRDATPTDRVTLPCGNCGRRIAWWTAELRTGWFVLQDAHHRGWKWQGECPIHFRGEFVDATCPSCGWARVGVARQSLPEWWSVPPEML